MGELWKGQGEKMDLDKEKCSEVNNKKTEMSIFCILTLFVYIYPQSDQKAKMV